MTNVETATKRLQVANARPDDAGRGIARVSRATMTALGLAEGDVVEAGAALGTVGDSGNARGTPPHLHYGVYGSDGALDPLPRMRAVR